MAFAPAIRGKASEDVYPIVSKKERLLHQWGLKIPSNP
jgi:hypothetical protein